MLQLPPARPPDVFWRVHLLLPACVCHACPPSLPQHPSCRCGNDAHDIASHIQTVPVAVAAQDYTDAKSLLNAVPAARRAQAQSYVSNSTNGFVPVTSAYALGAASLIRLTVRCWPAVFWTRTLMAAPLCVCVCAVPLFPPLSQQLVWDVVLNQDATGGLQRQCRFPGAATPSAAQMHLESLPVGWRARMRARLVSVCVYICELQATRSH